MKNLTKIFMAVAALVMAASCITDPTEDLGANVGAEGQTVLTLSLEETKTHLGKEVDGYYPLYWSEGDQISVNGAVSDALTAGGSEKGVFVIHSKLEYPYNVLYPANENSEVTFPTTQTYADGTFSTGSTPMYGYAEEAGDAIVMQHLTGLLRFDITGEETLASLVVSAENAQLSGTFAVDCTTGELTAVEGTTAGSVTLSFGKGLTLGAEPTPIYVAVPAGSYGTVSVTIYTADGQAMARKFSSDVKPISAGKVREFNAFAFEAGEGVEDGVYLIYSKESLIAFANAVNGATENFDTTYPNAKVVADIDMTGTDWASIEGYAGTFDGGNHKIQGLNAPLFGATPAVAIKNVKLAGVNLSATIKSNLSYGALVCQTTATGATIENCSVSGDMTITLNKPAAAITVGGIVGSSSTGITLNGVVNNVNIAVSGNPNKQTLNLGGVIGYIAGSTAATVGTLTNNGGLEVDFTSFSDSNPHIGGVVGYITCSVNTTNTSKVLNNGDLTIGNGTTKKIELGGVVGLINIANISVKNFHNRGNLTVDGLTATSWFNVGGITSYNQSSATYENVRNDGDITINNSVGKACFDVGGILGTVQNTTTFNGDIINTGNITIKNHGSQHSRWVGIAGIMGGDDNKAVTFNGNLSNSGTVKVIGGDFSALAVPFGIGGICGYMRKEVKNATNTGDVICATNHNTYCQVGGLVGYTIVKILNSKCYANVASFTWDGTAGGALTKSTNVGMITGGARSDASRGDNSHVGGKIGTSATVVNGTDGQLDVEVSYTQLTKNTYINYLYNAPITVATASVDICGYLSSITAEPDYTMDETTAATISTADELAAWAASDTKDEKHAMLTADIDMTGKDWTPIEGFTKIFDGNDNKIIGLTAPLFNTTSATIKNLHLTGVAIEKTITEHQPLAALACTYTGSTISNCSASGNIKITGNINNELTATSQFGGLIGLVSEAAELSNLTNNVNITVRHTFKGKNDACPVYVGGVVAHNTGAMTATKLTNGGNITIGDATSETKTEFNYYISLGGVIAHVGNTFTANDVLTNSGAITVTSGQAEKSLNIGSSLNVGGVVGYIYTSNTVTINNACVNRGAINVTGLAEKGDSFYLAGDLSLGGVFGRVRAATIVNNSLTNEAQGTININNGTYDGKFNFGGILGINSGLSEYHNLLHNKGEITIDNVTVNGGYFNVGGVLSYNSTTNTTFNNMKNEGRLTITKTSATKGHVDVGGVLGCNNTATIITGEVSNSGVITCDMTATVTSKWRGIGGVIGYYYDKTLNMSTATLTNSGDVICKGTYDVVQLGGIIGKINKTSFTYGSMKNSGNVTLDKNTVISDTANTFVGGIAGTTAIPINGARCFCDIIALNGVKVGFITGSPYSETINSTNSHVGGNIATTLNATQDGPAWSDPDDWTFIDFIYGDKIEPEVAINNKLGWLTTKIDDAPIGADGEPIALE